MVKNSAHQKRKVHPSKPVKAEIWTATYIPKLQTKISDNVHGKINIMYITLTLLRELINMKTIICKDTTSDALPLQVLTRKDHLKAWRRVAPMGGNDPYKIVHHRLLRWGIPNVLYIG